MKRVISFILVLCLLVPLGAIGAFADDSSSWELTEFVDDFGDPTGEAYLRSIVSGTFSNTATTDEGMKVIIGYSPDAAAFTFRLVEYDDTLKVKATYTDGDSKSIKIKIDDEITEGTLIGTPPNGDLLLTGGPCLIKIYNALVDGLDVRFIVEIADSKYSFSADGIGFSKCVEDYLTAAQVETDSIFYEGTNFHRLESLLSKNFDGTYILPNNNKLYTIAMKQEEEDISGGKHYHYEAIKVDPLDDKDFGTFGFEDNLRNYESEYESLEWCGFSTNGSVYYDGDGNRLRSEGFFGKDSFTYDIYINYAEE